MTGTMTTAGTATSADGTTIAYEVSGSGPALVLVDGAMCHRELGPSRGMAAALAGSFTVCAYDRRGRGGSGPGSTTYTPEREVEDMVAVVEAVGGHAHVFSASSGAALALEAARQGAPLDRLIAYEAPFVVDDTRPPNDPRLPERVQEMVDRGRRAEAVRTFLRTVGVPSPVVALMHLMPAWRRMTAIAHTLPYDLSMVVPHQQGRPLPEGCYDAVTAPTLVLAGGRSPAWMRHAQAAVAAAVPDSRLETLPGQTHMIKPAAVAPVVTEFLLG